MRCKNCSAEIPDDALFCDQCGTAIDIEGAIEETPSETASVADGDAELVDEDLDDANGTSDEQDDGALSEEAPAPIGEHANTSAIPTIKTSASWITVNPPTPPATPYLGRFIIAGVGIIALAVAVLILLGAYRFVLSLFG